MKPKLIAAVGANASGKSGLGVALAPRLQGYVIKRTAKAVLPV